jgi:hypothetical protein
MRIVKYIPVLIAIFFLLLFHGIGNAQGISIFSTDLPLIIIDTEGKTIVDDPKISAKMKIVNNSSGVNRFTDAASDFSGNVGIELRGSSSIGYPQKPWLFETRDAAGQNLDVSILGLPLEKDWILLSNYNDKSLMRNILGFKIFEKLGNYAPRAKLVDVILNNEYQGIYVLTEKIKQDTNRVDIAKLKKEDISGEELTGGYIFKIDYWNSSNSWQSPYSPIGYPNYKIHFVYHDPDWDVLTSQQKNYLKNYVTSFEQVLYSTNFQDEIQGYANFIDVKSFIDYFLVSEIARNNDGFKKSQYFHKDKSGKIVAGPVWDFDWAWKNINECFIFKATDGSGWAYKVNDCNPDVKSPDWMARLFNDDNFKNKVNCSYFDARSNQISNDVVFGMIDSLYNVVKNAQVKHFQKWQILGRNVGAPEIDAQPATYQGEVDKLKNWITLRLNWLDNNMMGKCSTVNTYQMAENQGIRIYPNPATDELNILTGLTISTIRIFDITGKTIFVNPLVNTEMIKIDVSAFLPGMYIVKMIDVKGNSVSEKMIVK